MVSRNEWREMASVMYGSTLGKVFGRRSTAGEREEGSSRLLGAKQRAARRMGTEGEEDEAAPEIATPTAPTPTPEARPRYEGPARTMPVVEGAKSVSPTPNAGAGPAAPIEERIRGSRPPRRRPSKPHRPPRLRVRNPSGSRRPGRLRLLLRRRPRPE